MKLQKTIDAIKEFQGKNGYSPSGREISEMTNISRQRATDCVIELEEKGYLEVIRHPSGSRKRNEFIILERG